MSKPSVPSASTIQSHWLKRVLPVAFLLATVALAGEELRGLDPSALRQTLTTIPALMLVGIQTAALAGVLLMSLYDILLNHWLEIRLPLMRVVRYAWIANAFNNLIGMSGLAGSGLRFLLLARADVSRKTNTAYSTIIMLSVPTGLSLLALPMLGSLDQYAHLQSIPSTVTLAVLVIIAAYLPVYVIGLGSERIHRRFFGGLPSLPFRRIPILLAISLLDWLAAAFISWLCLYSTGAVVSLTAYLAAFTLASALGIFSLVPGGLGVFDGMLLLILSATASSNEPILAGLLLYRLTYYVVPWLLALYLGGELLLTSDSRKLRQLAERWQGNQLLTILRLPLRFLSTIGIRGLSLITLISGIVLLISAAYPALVERFSLLNIYLPLAAIEASHLLSVGTGILLIALARGISEQVRTAYRAGLILLLAGAAFSLLKGLDIEEATLLLGSALLLRSQRRNFYRQGYPFLSLRTLLWGALLILAVLGYALLGNWVHGDLSAHIPALLKFAPHLDAPRFVRSLIFAILVSLGFLAWSYFRSATPNLQLPNADELEEARQLLERHGGNAYSHLIFLGDKYLFFGPDRRALIAFGRRRDRLIALGDPSGDPAAFASTIEAFRSFADRYALLPVFYEVMDTHVHVYHDLGFSLFKLGETAYVDVQQFSLAGKQSDDLRHSVNRAKRVGMRMELLQPPFNANLWPQLRGISDAWLEARGSAEKGFSLGRYDQDYLERSPVAAVRLDQRIVAFANLMPGYGGQTDLSIDLMRHTADAPPGTMDFLFVELIALAKAQGYQHFNLGMAPLGGVGHTRYSRPQERIARVAYEYGNRLYNYKGLRRFKEKFRPQWRSSYLAYPVFTPLPGLLIDIAALIAGGYRRIFTK
ncbi:MAG: bifunctional lysylphosphatidylglycerol flippase/synthetase MprF [Gammaproteobacteria bacterium]|nr:bifunctional lysylphosphatidylglycerol flippase/synthetase MprF [Gammaproteobacteria bacterium]